MSLTKRTTVPALRALPYSASQVPASTPSGVPMPIASAHITALPKKALARPPSCIGGGVILVNRSRLMPARPLEARVNRIQPRKNRPNRAVAQDAVIATTLPMRRRRYSESAVADISGPPCGTGASASGGRWPAPRR
ncbi:hypothetical protein G6F46_015117 [Rhizopus delemar]|nr:hypothetical protein G6F46_015117 [Rhizopus delemar]